MGRHPTGQRKYEVQHLWELHREVIRRLVLGQKPKAIAEDLRITPQTVSNIQNSAVAQKEIARLRAERDEEVRDVQEHIAEIAPKAVEVLEEMLQENVPHNLRLKAAQDVLDRAGYGAVRRSIELHGHLRPEDIDKIRARGDELRKQLYGGGQ